MLDGGEGDLGRPVDSGQEAGQRGCRVEPGSGSGWYAQAVLQREPQRCRTDGAWNWATGSIDECMVESTHQQWLELVLEGAHGRASTVWTVAYSNSRRWPRAQRRHRGRGGHGRRKESEAEGVGART